MKIQKIGVYNNQPSTNKNQNQGQTNFGMKFVIDEKCEWNILKSINVILKNIGQTDETAGFGILDRLLKNIEEWNIPEKMLQRFKRLQEEFFPGFNVENLKNYDTTEIVPLNGIELSLKNNTIKSYLCVGTKGQIPETKTEKLRDIATELGHAPMETGHALEEIDMGFGDEKSVISSLIKLFDNALDSFAKCKMGNDGGWSQYNCFPTIILPLKKNGKGKGIKGLLKFCRWDSRLKYNR